MRIENPKKNQIVIDQNTEREYYSALEIKQETAARLARQIFWVFTIFIFIGIFISIWDSIFSKDFKSFYLYMDKTLPILSAIIGAVGTYYFTK